MFGVNQSKRIICQAIRRTPPGLLTFSSSNSLMRCILPPIALFLFPVALPISVSLCTLITVTFSCHTQSQTRNRRCVHRRRNISGHSTLPCGTTPGTVLRLRAVHGYFWPGRRCSAYRTGTIYTAI
ncbi:hypothetical protein J6590_002263 [Homalodisca vitripennis]|nr:hypothetical protein J6590_002263 [Homalodisca vitripennis]